MAYLSSANVKVFPSAYRGTGIDPEARLNSERNLTTSLNSFADYNSGSFVLDYTNHVLKFIIGGYYFEVTLNSTYDTGTWYAHIKTVDRGGAGGAWACKSLARLSGTESDVLDASSTFYGLDIDDSATKEGCINLLLLSGGQVWPESKLKISSDSIGNPYTVAGSTVNVPISQTFITSSALIGTGGTGAFKVGCDSAFSNPKFSVEASNGNTTLRGDLRVKNANNNDSFVVEPSGNTSVGGTLAVTSTSTFTGTATFNGGATISSLTVNGNASVTGNISCANLDADIEVSCSSLSVSQIGGTNDVTLCKTLLPQNNVNLGSSSNLFNNVYSKGLYLLDTGSSNAFTISYSSGWNISTEGLTNFLAGGNLTIGRSGNATATFTQYEVTFNKKIIASKGIEVNGTTSSDVLQSNVDVKIASGKCLDLSGSSTGSIKLRGETDTGSTSHAVVGNGIYNITFKSNLSSAPNSTYSVTMALIIPNPSSLLDSTIYSSEVYRSGQYGWQIKAVHNSSGWTLTFTSGGDPASCNWFVTKIADVA